MTQFFVGGNDSCITCGHALWARPHNCIENLQSDLAAAEARAEAAEAKLAAMKGAEQWIPVSERLPEEGQRIWAKEHRKGIQLFMYSKALEQIFVRHYTHWANSPLPQEPQS